MRTALVVLAIALLAPLAAAQVPATPTLCGPIGIANPPVAPGPLAPGASASVVVDVQNGGSVPASVVVTTADAPQGWTVEAPAEAEVPAGGSGAFTFVVRVAEGAAEEAQLRFSATGTCESQLPTGCPGGVCSAGTANTQVTLRLAPQEGFRIPGLDGLGLPAEYLIAGVVLVGLASALPFAMRRKRAGVAADCPEPLKMVKAGRGTSFPIELRNRGKEPLSASFEVGPVPEGWSAFMPLPEVQLAAREARSLWLMVRSPQTARVGEAVDVVLHVRHAGKDLGVVKVRAEVQADGDAPA